MRQVIQSFGFPNSEEILLFRDHDLNAYVIEKRYAGQATVTCEVQSFNKALEIYTDLARNVDIEGTIPGTDGMLQ